MTRNTTDRFESRVSITEELDFDNRNVFIATGEVLVNGEIVCTEFWDTTIPLESHKEQCIARAEKWAYRKSQTLQGWVFND